MVTPKEKVAASLTVLHKLQTNGRHVFQSKELTRVHRERLRKYGFLREVMKGWLISSDPSADAGDSTSWYASFWEFCTRYCNERFGDKWYLSPEQSLLLQAASTVVPTQVIVCSPKGTSNTVNLLFGTSLYDLKQQEMPADRDLIVWRELRLFSPAAALIRVPEAFFTHHPVDAQVILATFRDGSDILGRLLDGGHSVVAGRLAGAFRRIGQGDLAEDILSTMKAAGYDVRETDPFTPQQTFGTMNVGVPPIIGRLQTLWESMRGVVVETLPPAQGLPKDTEAYLAFIDEIYKSDAYHSLSIEGYRVTPELIESVRSGDWDPDENESDRQRRDALAARGYWQAFQLVKKTVSKIITGANPSALVRSAHRDWYRELFQPCVAIGLIPASSLAGYRTDQVFLRSSRHVPPRWEAISDAMSVLFNLLEHETDPAVRAVLGHWLFGYVHPYQDGNGRIARFLMNAMLASGGYPWTVIRVENRTNYLSALETASVQHDIRPFAVFVANQVQISIDQSRQSADQRHL